MVNMRHNLRATRALLLIIISILFSTGLHAKTISLEEMVIEGSIQKPEAFFILPRTALKLDDLDRRENLLLRIIESVENSPF